MAWGLPVAQATYGSVSLRRHRKTLPMDGVPSFFPRQSAALPFPLLRMNRGWWAAGVSWWGSRTEHPKTERRARTFTVRPFFFWGWEVSPRGNTLAHFLLQAFAGSSGVKSEGVQAGKLQPGGHPPVTGANLEEKKNPFFFSPICSVRVASQAFSGTHPGLANPTKRNSTMCFSFSRGKP